MFFPLLVLLFSFQLVAQSTAASTVGALSGVPEIYPIDTSQRGTDILNLWKSLYNMSVAGNAVYEVGFQTKYNGFLPWVVNVTGTTNNTLLIVQTAATKQQALQTTTPPLIIPAEQIVEVIFSTGSTTITTAPTFGASNVMGTLPIYSLSSAQRAADIIAVYTYYTGVKSVFQNMTIQTTLVGNPPNQIQGTTQNNIGLFLPYVQNVTKALTTVSPFLLITYLPTRRNPPITINVAAEQVSGITFTLQ